MFWRYLLPCACVFYIVSRRDNIDYFFWRQLALFRPHPCALVSGLLQYCGDDAGPSLTLM